MFFGCKQLTPNTLGFPVLLWKILFGLISRCVSSVPLNSVARCCYMREFVEMTTSFNWGLSWGWNLILGHAD